MWVWNWREGNKERGEGRGHYVGRGPDSPLGNPFKIGRDGPREEGIEKYRGWLRGIVKRGRGEDGGLKMADGGLISPLSSSDEEREKTTEARAWERLIELKEVAERGDLNLLCYCKPLACHADVIKACIEWLMKQGAVQTNAQEVQSPRVQGPKSSELCAIALERNQEVEGQVL